MWTPKPLLPEYSISDWEQKPFFERLKMVCASWAIQGYGTPTLLYFVYLLKIGFYVWMWGFFCGFSPGMGDWSTIGSWWHLQTAFQKAVLWSVLFEVLGLGCGSGPLTGRYFPPFGGALYFLRPGTTKLPLFPNLPLLGGVRRNILDVLVYAALIGFLTRALIAPAITMELVWPIVGLVLLAGLLDKTIFLAARSDHYLAAIICYLFAGQEIAGSKLVWVAIWWGAATSKLNRHFPSVVAVMISNSPVTRIFPPMRKLMYRNYPEDLRPSRLTTMMAHMGTVTEYSFPLVLLLSPGGQVTQIALITMLLFHIFISSHVPMGVPLEWNVVMVYGAFVLFGANAGVSVLSLSSPLLIAALAILLLVIPLIGNFFPRFISFLCSMRYYAGNWGVSVWLFKGDASRKLDENLTKAAPRVMDQLARFYDEDTVKAVASKVIAFRAMHLHGRTLRLLLPRAVDDIEDYEYWDGELVAGVVLGWNFGEGHLHNHNLLRAVQAQCDFKPGELRHIFLESQPMGRARWDWTISDAATGVIEKGQTRIDEVIDVQPWDPAPNAARS